ncbi:MAG TPA: hypothetical protein DCZ95_18800 [Verrucomicrobia bacterium]|nr:MAG: hypothetical protein A2X46_17040 [Lentisphaerae bacterium GWF2_57_35]HBA86136.1 hypothetical protein [Verrucomicrobiota bacterium]
MNRLNRWVATDDWDRIKKTGVLRVLVAYSQSNFFIDKGEHRGFEYELLKGFPEFIQKTKKGGPGEFVLLFVPVPFEELLPALLEGKGDVAAAGLTITPVRLQKIAFTEPYLRNVDEVTIAAPNTPPPKALEDLQGREICVLPSSSFAEPHEAV